MKLTLSLSLKLTRDRTDPEGDEPRDIDLGAVVERADDGRTIRGLSVEPPSWEDRR